MKNHILLLLGLLCTALHTAIAQSGISIEKYLLDHHIQAQVTPDGLRYLHEVAGNGPAPLDGDYVLIEYKAMLLDGSVFDGTEGREPFVFQVGNREVIRGLDLGMRLMKKGGKAVFFIPAKLGYMQYGVEGTVPPDSPLRYEVTLLDVMDFDQYDQYMRDLEEKERIAFERQRKEQFETDLRLIREYAVTNNLRVQRTSSGLCYAVTKPGKGPTARKGNRLIIQYEGYFLDGNSFEMPENPFEFVLGSARVIEGWEEGLQFFNKGSEGWLLVPSKLGYGPVAVRHIPPNSVLVFKMKVLDIL